MVYLWAYVVVALLVAGVTIATTRAWDRDEPVPDALWVLIVDGVVIGMLWPLLLLAWLAWEVGARIYLRDYRPPDQ
jgi:hypothetical protein